MRARNALYEFVENLIATAATGTPLKDAVSARTLSFSVNTESKKVVRMFCGDGEMQPTDEAKTQETDCRSVIQFYVTPQSSSLADEYAALELSYDMARVVFDAMIANPSLSGQVCQVYFKEFDSDMDNLGATRRAATYLYGTVNPAGSI